MKTRPTRRSLEKFDYFSQCEDALRMPAIPHDPNGHTAAECFHVAETYGKRLPCREPELFTRALNGKEQHGLTVTHVAEDYVDRLMFAVDLKEYPEWVRKDILGRAGQIALIRFGYIPTYVETGEDFSTLTTLPTSIRP